MDLKNKIIIILLLFIFLLFSSLAFSYSSDLEKNDIVGSWLGTLKVSGHQLRVVFNVTLNKEKELNATMDSPDQGVTGIPVNKINIDKKAIKFIVSSVHGYYKGNFIKEKNIIKGTWHQGGLSLPLVLKHSKKPPKVERPQTPKKPYPYNEEIVEFNNTKDDVTLAGTLTIPPSNGPFTAVILISGSGPQDRDETIFGHKPFLVIADYLTKRGIAVLRFDDRGVGKSTGDFSKATSKDLMRDVLAGIKYLKTRKKIASEKIGLIGHSEGGIIAPMAAVNSSDVSFIVLMAGTGLPGEQILYQQGKLILEKSGADQKAIENQYKTQKKLFSIIKSKDSKQTKEKKFNDLLKNEWKNMDNKIKKQYGKFEFFLKSQKRVLSPWMDFFLTYDPGKTLKKVKCPVLAINGEKDLQVPPEENLKAIEKALKAGNNKNFTIKELKGLNHLFQEAKTGLPSEYVQIKQTISPKALETMGNWIANIILFLDINKK